MLRQYNGIINECLAALKSSGLPEMEKLRIEVQLYTLKRRLLNVDPLTSKEGYGNTIRDFEELKERITRCKSGEYGDPGDVLVKLDELITNLPASR